MYIPDGSSQCVIKKYRGKAFQYSSLQRPSFTIACTSISSKWKQCHCWLLFEPDHLSDSFACRWTCSSVLTSMAAPQPSSMAPSVKLRYPRAQSELAKRILPGRAFMSSRWLAKLWKLWWGEKPRSLGEFILWLVMENQPFDVRRLAVVVLRG